MSEFLPDKACCKDILIDNSLKSAQSEIYQI